MAESEGRTASAGDAAGVAGATEAADTSSGPGPADSARIGRTPTGHTPTGHTQTRRAYSPRERMVFSAAQLIRRDGVAATGMREVAAHAQAPRGSLQHYFPGGKEQLVNEAVAWGGRYAGRRVARFMAAMDAPTPGGLFAAMVAQWRDEYLTSGFAAGCPVAAATVDCAESVPSTREAVAAAFATWNVPVAEALVSMGVAPTQASDLATVMISTLEGAILIARAEQDVRALDAAATQLGPMLDACVRRG
jgi:AcrR family transcriptional regulator